MFNVHTKADLNSLYSTHKQAIGQTTEIRQKMLTLDRIKSDFSYLDALINNSEDYYDSPIFEGNGEMCDSYFKSKDNQIKQEQVDKYNDFKENYKIYLPEIEMYILNSLKNSEVNLENKIRQSKLTLDINDIPF